jgi:hypothetical protein
VTRMQAVVDAVAALLEAGAFGDGAGQSAVALEFLAEHLAEGRATAAPPLAMAVLQFIALGPWPAARPDRRAQARGPPLGLGFWGFRVEGCCAARRELGDMGWLHARWRSNGFCWPRGS